MAIEGNPQKNIEDIPEVEVFEDLPMPEIIGEAGEQKELSAEDKYWEKILKKPATSRTRRYAKGSRQGEREWHKDLKEGEAA